MGKSTGRLCRAFALALILLATTACAQADTARKRFDIAAQPAAAALNEFARQADITLIFSYDLVAGARTRALKGNYTVDDGLARLLAGTGLGHQQVGDDAFLICRPSSCEPSHRTEGRGTAGQGGVHGLGARVAENAIGPVSMTSR